MSQKDVKENLRKLLVMEGGAEEEEEAEMFVWPKLEADKNGGRKAKTETVSHVAGPAVFINYIKFQYVVCMGWPHFEQTPSKHIHSNTMGHSPESHHLSTTFG
mgnify:CR=1 FL=1